MGADGETAGSFVAISTFDTEIEIWNLDVMDAMQPVAVLGGLETDGKAPAKGKSSKKKSSKSSTFKKGSHKDSVLSLAWNATYRNVLASGSADKTVKVRTALMSLRLVVSHDIKDSESWIKVR